MTCFYVDKIILKIFFDHISEKSNFWRSVFFHVAILGKAIDPDRP